MPKNIWYIAKYANILKYGFNTRQFSFCKEFNKQGHKATLILGNSSHLSDNLPHVNGKFMHEMYEGVDIIWINLPKYNNATSIKRFWTWILFEYKIVRLRKKFPVNKPDVVVGSSLSLLSVLSASFLKRRYNAKFIFEVRDIWPQTLIDLKGISKHNPIAVILRMIERFGYKNANHVVGTMPGLYKHVNKSVKKKVNVINIPQSVDLDFYANNQEQLSNEFVEKYLPKDKFTITYAGTLGISYALDKVIEAAIILNKSNPEVHFLFLGNGIEKEKLIKQSEGINNVSFVPRVHKQQVLDFLSRSSVLLHSFQMKSVFEYGISPNKFIDYMYSARPVIVMFSGFPSIINEAGCGEFIPSEDVNVLVDTINKYLKMEKNELNKIGQRGKKYLINNLTFNELAREYAKLF